jgi:hypothetical protein
LFGLKLFLFHLNKWLLPAGAAELIHMHIFDLYRDSLMVIIQHFMILAMAQNSSQAHGVLAVIDRQNADKFKHLR